MRSVPGSARSPGGGNGNPLQYFCLEYPMDRGTWWAIVRRVKKTWTRLKWHNTTKIGVTKTYRGNSHALPLMSITANRKMSVTPTGRSQLCISAGKEVPYTPQKKVELPHYPGKREEDFLLTQQQAQPMENAAAQPMRNHHHPSLSFPLVNIHVFLADDFIS